MSEINDDRIDLKPYFKLFRKTLKSVETWIFKKVAFIILSFILLVGIFYGLDTLKEPRYKMSAIIDKDFVSSEQLKSVLHSTKINIEASNTPKFFESFQNKLGNDVKIFKLEYAIITSFNDSIIIKRVESTLDNLENDGPAIIELVTNFENDSIGHLFIEYLNNHPYVNSIRNSKIDFHKDRLSALNKEINEIDTLINNLLGENDNNVVNKKENSRSVVTFNENKSTIYNLFLHKDNLIREKEEISNKLKFMSSTEIYPVGEFYQPKEIDKFTIFSVRTIIKFILLSFFVVLLFSFVIKRTKKS